ncbi:MAG: PucR family transcriptional regulator ligand-binding domain-containing protein [Negativicutes bacterium]|nr:PucR family transcriptional regulator ligand-binding domain-containing protein [Negativicutes bacterium]
MPRDLGIPLKEILAHPSFAHARLVGGAAGIDRLVKYVNVMEVPDITEWVKEGELLLTTVYALRNDIGAQSRLIPELAAKKLAGLAIKPGRYIEKIPDIMIAQADEYKLPLIELPLVTSFSDIINPITSEILDHQAMILRQADEVHAKLSQVVLEGGSLPEIAAALSQLLHDNMVIIENSLGEIVAKAADGDQDIDPGLALLARGKGGDDPGQIWRGKSALADGETGFARLSICAGKKCYGVITVYETSRDLSGRDEITIERAATVAALEMVNRLAINAVETRYYNEFINEMLMADPSEEKSLRQRAKDLGLDLGRIQSAAVIHIVNLQAEGNGSRLELGDDSEDDKIIVLQHVVQSLKDRFPEVAIGYKYDSILLFLSKPRAGGTETDKSRIRGIQEYVEERLRGIYPASRVLVGAGRPGNGLAALQNSYREALRAYQLGQAVWPDQNIYYFGDLGVYRLLASITDENALRIFVEETIGPILAYDQKKDSELLKTLERYFECQGNLRKVSESMFVHYNTVLYRLDRVAALIGADLGDPAVCLNLQLGLKAYRLLETSWLKPTKTQ